MGVRCSRPGWNGGYPHARVDEAHRQDRSAPAFAGSTEPHRRPQAHRAVVSCSMAAMLAVGQGPPYAGRRVAGLRELTDRLRRRPTDTQHRSSCVTPIGWALAHRSSTLASPRSADTDAEAREHVHACSAKIRTMLRRLLTLLLMLCLATGAAANGCPMAVAAKAAGDANAHAGMPDCPHARAASAAQAASDDAVGGTSSFGKAGCDHCTQCRVQVPPVEIVSLLPLLSPTHAPGFRHTVPPSPCSAPNLRPPISSSPAHHA